MFVVTCTILCKMQDIHCMGYFAENSKVTFILDHEVRKSVFGEN